MKIATVQTAPADVFPDPSDAVGEYTNTATASPAETNTVSDSVPVSAAESGAAGGTGTTGSGTTTAAGPRAGEIIWIATPAVMAPAANRQAL